ncbi:MAG: tRNA (N(6)-L-threonylcarbamoyladenosine(37)-C(2))-methylthiotransferase MtaB [Armatimonadota bacterium]
MTPTAAIKTLGCKLNQFEAEQIREQLLRLGYTITDFSSPADLYVINTCTVTSQADRDARKLARQARRLSPQAFIVLTGCYAEVAAEQLQAMPEVDLVCGMADKLRLDELVPRPAEGTEPIPHASHLLEQFADHTRCFVKVQEGCNARCSYCIIPDARGPSRSVPFAEVYAQTQQLAQAGHPELVLIGTHLGQYGRDLEEEIDLAGLIERLLAIPEVQRLRLSSMEPREVTPEIVAMIERGGHALTVVDDPAAKLCRYLHIPLQSGCDSVLQRMNRPYTAAFYAELIHRIKQAQPLTGLGADVIVGFPGETDEEFELTRSLLETLPLSYLHVFSYSPRRGTPAASMPDQVPPPVKSQRSLILRQMSEQKRMAFAQEMVGHTLETVLQTTAPDGLLQGVTDNYLQLRVQAEERHLGKLAACEVVGVEDGVLMGRL